MGPSPGPPPQTTKGPAALWKPAHSLLSFSFLRVVSLTEAVIQFFTQNAWYAGCRHPPGSRGRSPCVARKGFLGENHRKVFPWAAFAPFCQCKRGGLRGLSAGKSYPLLLIRLAIRARGRF